MKFRLFQKPANFEQRLQECKRILDEVKLQVPKMEMKSVEQEVVQSQLDHCMVNIQRCCLSIHFLPVLSFKFNLFSMLMSVFLWEILEKILRKIKEQSYTMKVIGTFEVKGLFCSMRGG